MLICNYYFSLNDNFFLNLFADDLYDLFLMILHINGSWLYVVKVC